MTVFRSRFLFFFFFLHQYKVLASYYLQKRRAAVDNFSIANFSGRGDFSTRSMYNFLFEICEKLKHIAPRNVRTAISLAIQVTDCCLTRFAQGGPLSAPLSASGRPTGCSYFMRQKTTHTYACMYMRIYISTYVCMYVCIEQTLFFPFFFFCTISWTGDSAARRSLSKDEM